MKKCPNPECNSGELEIGQCAIGNFVFCTKCGYSSPCGHTEKEAERLHELVPRAEDFAAGPWMPIETIPDDKEVLISEICENPRWSTGHGPVGCYHEWATVWARINYPQEQKS